MNKLNIEAARDMGMLFLNLHESGNAKVDMREVDFQACGTVACHAGWYAISRGLSWCVDCHFAHAADGMAKELGFEGRKSLEHYFEESPELWGNNLAEGMFCLDEAFGNRKDEPLTLEDIGLHWLKVADRCEVAYGQA